MALICCKQITMQYENVPVLENVSFLVEEGDYLAIVGENGSGKSTLIKGLLGLMKPKSGTIAYGEGFRASAIGFLPQQTAVQKDFPASVREVVLSGCRDAQGYRPYYTKAQKTRAAHEMERLGILPLAKKSYRELSGGQQQRVLLARALAGASRLLILDEPTNGLDALITAELYEIMESVHRQGTAVIVISHDIKGSVQRAKHILHLGQKEMFFGTCEQYRQSPLGKSFLKGGLA